MSRAVWIAGGAIVVVLAVVLAVVLVGGHSSAGNRAAAAGSANIASATSVVAPSSSPLTTAATPPAAQTQGIVATQTVVRTVTAPPPKPSSPFATYRNSDYGFTVQLPSSYEMANAASGSVATFESADGKVQVTVYDRPRNSATPGQDETAAKQQFEGAGGDPTYTSHSSDEYIVSGYTSAGDVYYEFRFYGTHGIGGFDFTYPRSNKPESDAAVAHAYKTFQPGGL